MKQRRDKPLVEHIIASITDIYEFIGDDINSIYNDKKTKAAVCKHIEIIGEASAHLSASLKEKYPDIAWTKIKAMRNHLTHEYFDIDYDEVKNVVENKLPSLLEQMKKILGSLG